VVLALPDDPDGILADLIAQSQQNLDEVREAAVGALTPGQGAVEGHVPFAPDAKKALDLALREAIRLGDGYIGNEHLVLGLLRDKKSDGAVLLGDAGITHAGAEEWLESRQ
jgi:ATP-dependent Clp protease ATP-binding subunit ClpA